MRLSLKQVVLQRWKPSVKLTNSLLSALPSADFAVCPCSRCSRVYTSRIGLCAPTHSQMLLQSVHSVVVDGAVREAVDDTVVMCYWFVADIILAVREVLSVVYTCIHCSV